MQIGSRALHTGDNRRIVVDYHDWLRQGATLSIAAIILVGPVQSVVSAQSFDEARVRLIFHIQAGAVSEVFTARVQVTSTDGQVVSDTIGFTVTS